MASLFRSVKLLPDQGRFYSMGKDYLGHGIRGSLSHTSSKDLQKRIDHKNETTRPVVRAKIAVHFSRLSKNMGKHLLDAGGLYYLGAQGGGVPELLREGDQVECYAANTPKADTLTLRALVRKSNEDEHLEALQAGKLLKDRIMKLKEDNKWTWETAVRKFVSKD